MGSTTIGKAWRRIVGVVPAWVTSTNWHESCAMASTRDVLKMTRRFRRLRYYLEVGKVEATTGNEIAPIASVATALAVARATFGAALETFAQLKASSLVPASRVPTSTPRRAALARLTHDAYSVAVWTDAHANYAIDLSDDTIVDQAETNRHFDRGQPTIRGTVSMSAMPNLSSKIERLSAIEDSKLVLGVIARCIQSGTRGWDSSMKQSLRDDGARRILHLCFRACLLGMHPQLHPACRPDWSNRAIMRRVLDAHLTTAEMDAAIMGSPTAMKESVRLYVCSLFADLPAIQAAYARCGHALGLFRSTPVHLVAPALQASAQALVAAAAATAKELQLTNGGTAEAPSAVLCRHLDARLNGKPPPAATDGGARPSMTAAQSKATMVVFSPSWLGRGTSLEDATPSQSPNVLTVVGALLERSFRMTFMPLWIHGHSHGIRVSRLDASQHLLLHDRHPNHVVTKLLDDETLLAVQRLAIRHRAASSLSIGHVVDLLEVDDESFVRVASTRSVDDAIAAVCSMRPIDGAKVILFAKVVALKSNFVAFDLGARTRKLQLRALRRRFSVPDDVVHDDDVVKSLPRHAHELFNCLECNRKGNAVVACDCKPISHNEVGIAQTMLRSGRVGEDDEIRCARRSSAALRTAMQKEQEAEDARIEKLQVCAKRITDAFIDNGEAGNAARMRRDMRGCELQLHHAVACGDRTLVSVSAVGRVIKIQNTIFCLCSFCGSIFHVKQSRRYAGEMCCCRCDTAMLGLESAATSSSIAPTTRVAPMPPPPVPVDDSLTPKRASACIDADKLTCRFCAKLPSTSGLTRFRVLRAPLDAAGRNGLLPPPLRVAAFCTSHYRGWLEGGLTMLPMSIIFAHLSEKAVPVFGAQTGRRSLTLAPAIAKPNTAKARARKSILKRAPKLKH